MNTDKSNVKHNSNYADGDKGFFGSSVYHSDVIMRTVDKQNFRKSTQPSLDLKKLSIKQREQLGIKYVSINLK